MWQSIFTHAVRLAAPVMRVQSICGQIYAVPLEVVGGIMRSTSD
jgi:hypothetical protein